MREREREDGKVGEQAEAAAEPEYVKPFPGPLEQSASPT